MSAIIRSKMRNPKNVSFAGCGFLGIYHLGVAVCLRRHAPQLLMDRLGGASAGALTACCLLCDLPPEAMAGDFLRIVRETRRHALGAFSPWFNLPDCLLEGMQRRLPADAHLRVSGRLHVSLTRVRDRRNVMMSEFSSRYELLQALLCSCFIPGISGLVPPKVRGVRYMDGAFSNNLPLLDAHTVTVSPFCGGSDICPRDRNPHMLQVNLNLSNTCIRLSRRNLGRMVRIVLPGRIDFMASFCQQGYDDALRFLRCSNLLDEDPVDEVLRQEDTLFNWLRQQHREGELQDQKRLQEAKEAATQKQEQTSSGDEAKMVAERRYRYPMLGYGLTGTLLTSTWSLLSRLGVPSLPLERIRQRFGRRMTLFGQPPTFDLPAMQAPGPDSSTEGDNEEVKATDGVVAAGETAGVVGTVQAYRVPEESTAVSTVSELAGKGSLEEWQGGPR